MKKLESAPEHLIERFISGATTGSQEIAERIRENASGKVLKQRSGRLAESVGLGAPEVDGLQGSVLIEGAGGDAFYGIIQQEGGERAYMEEAKGKAMVFETAGETTFAKMVEHPPLQPRDWFYEALPELTGQVIAHVDASIKEGLQE